MSLSIYNWHPVTKEYIPHLKGTSQPKADPNPLEPGAYIIPGYSTSKRPPNTKENRTAVFNKKLNNWSTVDDYRGWKGFDFEGNEVLITELRKKPKKTWSIEKPFILDQEILIKTEIISKDFLFKSREPVDVLNIIWNGGINTIIRLELLIRLAVSKDLKTVTFTDNFDNIHKLKIKDAYKVVNGLNYYYQDIFLDKQKRKSLIGNAKNKSELDKIT